MSWHCNVQDRRSAQLPKIERRAGFTLVELLVVIAIIGVLIALLLPAVQSAREAARRSACVNQVKQQATALQLYLGQQSHYPTGGRIHDLQFQPGIGWRVLILPFIEEQSLYDRISPTPNGGAQTWAPQAEMPPLYLCPSAEPAPIGPNSLQTSSYWGVAGALRADEGLDLEDVVCGDLDSNGFMFPGSQTQVAMIEDGTSHTLALGERTYIFKAWMNGSNASGNPHNRICSEAANQIRYPINADHGRWGYYVGHNPLPAGGERKMLLNNLPFGSLHSGGANFAAADGSVHFLSEEIDFVVFENLATIAGGEVNLERSW